MKPASNAFLMTLLGMIALSACRQADDGNYVRVAGQLFIFNYREAVATYVISLQRLRPLPGDANWKATFEDPQGGEPLVVSRKVYPGTENIGVESDPVFCILKGKPYKYTIELFSNNKSLQVISGSITSTLSQDILPDKPLVVGPGYDKNPGTITPNGAAKRALGMDRCDNVKS